MLQKANEILGIIDDYSVILLTKFILTKATLAIHLKSPDKALEISLKCSYLKSSKAIRLEKNYGRILYEKYGHLPSSRFNFSK